MKWNRYSIKTTTQAVDLISSALDRDTGQCTAYTRRS